MRGTLWRGTLSFLIVGIVTGDKQGFGNVGKTAIHGGGGGAGGSGT